MDKAQRFPNACKDPHGRLRVGASVGTGGETDARVAALVEAGVDVIVVDTTRGHSKKVLEHNRWMKQSYPDMRVIGGNVATREGTRALIDAGVDAVKVGIGPGSICTTRILSGIGVPQITAVSEAVEEAANDDIIQTMRTRPHFVKISGAAMMESHVHDVSITKEAPNYPLS